MLLTVSTTHRPATDLGFLLHKHPERVQEFSQSFGVATVFYPEASEQRCTAALLLEIDPVRLARGRGAASPGFSLGHYVNDRPYVASSLLAVALADVFRTARAGRCPARPQLADTAIPLQITIPGLPCRGGPDIAHRVFGPLGWEVAAEPIPLDEAFPEWGDSPYLHLTLTGVVRLADALNQLHVLLPALDESKHYWQGPAEVEMLLRSGEGWLSTHPERELITRRYLSHLGELTTVALARLAELDDEVDHARGRGEDDDAGQPEPRRTPLARQRHEAVLEELRTLGAGSVIDLGCGSGDLLRRLLESPSLTRLAGCDVSMRSLSQARRRLHLDDLSERQADRIKLFHGSLTYEDDRFAGFDAAVLMEVIEHLDPSRLGALEQVVFGRARPGAVLVTTPNRDYNPRYAGVRGSRHPDHRFEWSRAEFSNWCDRVATSHGYTVQARGVGDPDDDLGSPTQLATFTRRDPAR